MKKTSLISTVFFLTGLTVQAAAQPCFSLSEVKDIRSRLQTSPEQFTQTTNRYGYVNHTDATFLAQFRHPQEQYLISESTGFSGGMGLPGGEQVSFLNKFPAGLCISQLTFTVPDHYVAACDDYLTPPVTLNFYKTDTAIACVIDSAFNTNTCVAGQLKTKKNEPEDAYIAYHFPDKNAGDPLSPFAFSQGSTEPFVAGAPDEMAGNQLPVAGEFKYADFWRADALIWLTEEQGKTWASVHAYMLSWQPGTDQLTAPASLSAVPLYTDTLACPGAELAFVYNGLRITHFRDTEAWLKTRGKCTGNTRWQTRIIMYDGKQLHIMSGTSAVPADPLLPVKGNRDFQFDNAFLTAPQPVRDFAEKLWFSED